MLAGPGIPEHCPGYFKQFILHNNGMYGDAKITWLSTVVEDEVQLVSYNLRKRAELVAELQVNAYNLIH